MKKSYYDKVHTWGRIWSILALTVLFSVPLGISIYYDAWPEITPLLKALMSLIPIYWISAIVEVITYTPMLGAGGTYLSFVTGNITNLKLPCGLSAMNAAKVKANSEEGEVFSTIAIGVSAITTTIIIAVGVLAFSPVLPVLTDPASILSPAFARVIPALFGALLASYLRKFWKISIVPIVVGCIVLAFVPSFGVGTLLFVTIVASIAGVFVMNKFGILEKKKK